MNTRGEDAAMADIEDLRDIALALPETTVGTHFRLASYQVSGKNFITIHKDGRLNMSIDPARVADIVAENPAVFAELRRFDKPIGITVDLAKVRRKRLAELVELAWRSQAPKNLVAAKDTKAGAGDD
jgi:hypothetical protein